MSREAKLEQALKNLLTIIGSDEWRGTEVMAGIHGYTVSKEIAMRNGKWVVEARELVGEEVPEHDAESGAADDERADTEPDPTL
jgi:hypothetical protein